jgi:hypothetical protein
MTLAQFEQMFASEELCAAYLVSHRWPHGVHCPRCGSANVFALRTRAFKWECMDCGVGTSYRFSHIVGTVFENSNKPLRDWYRVIHMMLTTKRCVSALQIKHALGFGSYETAWSMCRRIRAGLLDDDFRRLVGVGGIDEARVVGDGGVPHNEGRKKVGENGAVRNPPSIGAVANGGDVAANMFAESDLATCPPRALRAFGQGPRLARSTREHLHDSRNPGDVLGAMVSAC